MVKRKSIFVVFPLVFLVGCCSTNQTGQGPIEYVYSPIHVWEDGQCPRMDSVSAESDRLRIEMRGSPEKKETIVSEVESRALQQANLYWHLYDAHSAIRAVQWFQFLLAVGPDNPEKERHYLLNAIALYCALGCRAEVEDYESVMRSSHPRSRRQLDVALGYCNSPSQSPQSSNVNIVMNVSGPPDFGEIQEPTPSVMVNQQQSGRETPPVSQSSDSFSDYDGDGYRREAEELRQGQESDAGAERKTQPSAHEQASEQDLANRSVRTSSWVEIDSLLESLEKGEAGFITPDESRLDEVLTIRLVVSEEPILSALNNGHVAFERTEGIGRNATVRVARVSISKRMKATLSGLNFDIDPINDEIQQMGKSGGFDWRWKVKAKEIGVHSLSAVLSAEISIDGKERFFEVESFEGFVNVTETPRARITRFLGQNWRWICSMLVFPAFVALRKVIIGLRNHRKKAGFSDS